LEGLQQVDIATGGDHGGRRFHMGLKVLLRFANKEPITRIFEIANVSHSSDDIANNNETVLS
jgi:hypothetical protein